MDCSPPGSSVHGIFQAKTLEWVAISFSRGSCWLRDQTCIFSSNLYHMFLSLGYLKQVLACLIPSHQSVWRALTIASNKISGGDGIPVELFQILKDDTMKVLHSIWQQIWKTQQWPQDWKRSVFIPIPKKGNAKECSNHRTITLISHASKVMQKFSKPGFSNTWTVTFQMFKLVLEKAEEPEIKLPIYTGSPKKWESSKKTSIWLWLCGSQITVGNSWHLKVLSNKSLFIFIF